MPLGNLEEADVVPSFAEDSRELVPVLAAHADIDALDVWGVPDDLRVDVETAAADDIKRLARRPRASRATPRSSISCSIR